MTCCLRRCRAPARNRFPSRNTDSVKVQPRSGVVLAFTAPFNFSGSGEISVPRTGQDGLPIGVQFAGRYGDRQHAAHGRTAGSGPPLVGRRPLLKT